MGQQLSRPGNNQIRTGLMWAGHPMETLRAHTSMYSQHKGKQS